MDISISLSISDTVTTAEWQKVYEESLKLVKAFPFCEIVNREFFGQDLVCAVRTEERIERGRAGWKAAGDFITLQCAEEYYLPGKLPKRGGKVKEKEADALMGIAPAYTMIGRDDERVKHCEQLWGNKTQGKPYHMYLLAAACMVEERLEGKAVVHGDITGGQCRRAVEMANEVLEHPIRIPVRCDLERFYARVRSLPLTVEEILHFFIRTYMGERDHVFGEFIREHFTKEEMKACWNAEFREMGMYTEEFEELFCEYLEMGFAPEELRRYISFVDKEGNECYDYFMKNVMQDRVHKQVDGAAENFQKKDESERERYVISEYEDLANYKEGDSICPSLRERILKSYQFYAATSQEENFDKLMQMDYKQRCRFLINRSRNLILKTRAWEKIFDDIQMNEESFRRYYPMVRMRLSSDGLRNLARAFVTNDALFEFCEEHYKEYRTTEE